MLIANTASAPVTVNVYAFPENRLHDCTGSFPMRSLVIPANSRRTVPLSSLVAGAARSAVEVVETGLPHRGSLVVEGAIYWNADGVAWAAGAAFPATRIY